MPELNPYAAPSSRVDDVSGLACYRIGKSLFVPAGSDLPPRCIMCNAPAALPIKKRTMHWHTQWLYLLFLLNILIYVVVALIVRKRVEVSPGYCELHHASRKKRLLIALVPGVGLMLAGVGISFLGEGQLGVLLFILGLVLLIPAYFVNGHLRPTRIDGKGARFAGCKEPFLSSLEQDR